MAVLSGRTSLVEVTRLTEDVGIGAHDLLVQGLEAHPAVECSPTCARVWAAIGRAERAVRRRIRRRPAAATRRSSCASQHRSSRCSQNAASSTVSPTVRRPWCWRSSALLSPSAPADRAALVGAVHDAREVVEDRVVVVERARVLAQRLQQAAGRRPRPAAPGVGVRDRGDVGPRPVDLGVDRERRRVHGSLTGEERRPSRSTSSRSDAPRWRQLLPNGLSQNRCGNSGSRTVMWPATQWSYPSCAKSRYATARRPLRWAAFLLDRRERRRRHWSRPTATPRGGPSRAPPVLVPRRAARARDAAPGRWCRRAPPGAVGSRPRSRAVSRSSVPVHVRPAATTHPRRARA